MEIQKISETAQKFDGVTYYLCGTYFQRKGHRLHRVVWEYHNGEIPDGYHIHHRDGDRSNNDISNLELLEGHEHLSGHMSTPEGAQKARPASVQPERPPACGTARMQEGASTQSWGLKIGKSGRFKHTFAASAERHIRPSSFTRKARIISVGRTARRHFGGGGFGMKVKSVRRAGRADVYNMEVEETHDFVIQGGVISHNCADEWRYFCMSRPVKPMLAVPEKPQWIDPLNMMEER